MRRTLSFAVAALLLAAAPGGAGADSRIVVREGADRVVAIPAQGGHPRVLARFPRQVVLGIGASADGRVLAASTRSTDPTAAVPTLVDRVWIKRGASPPRLIRTVVSVGKQRAVRPVTAVAVAPTGRRVLVVRRNMSVVVMGTDGSGAHAVPTPGYRFAPGPRPNTSGPEFTPNGREIVASFEQTVEGTGPICAIGTVPLSGGKIDFIRDAGLAGGLCRFRAPTISPDGRFVAFIFRNGGGNPDRTMLRVMRRDGSGLRRLVAGLRVDWELANPSFSPSGRAIAFIADRTFSLDVVDLGRSPSRLYTVRRDGRDRRLVRTEKARRFTRNPVWVR